MPKSIIIIGAGLSGLSAGSYAQMNGYNSRILEHHTKSGGVAATWKREGYTIDGGIHFVTDHKPGTKLNSLYQELGISQPYHFTDIHTYGQFLDEESGNSVQISTDLAALAKDLKAISPDDSPIIDDLISGANSMRGLDFSTMGMGKPPELATPIDRLREMWQMRRVYKYLGGKYANSVVEYVADIQSLWLQEFMKSVFLPDVPVWFIFMILAALADDKAAYLTHGSQDLVGTLEKTYTDLGGQITFNSTVECVLVENDVAVGVRLADGTEHHADFIISTGDGYRTIFNLLDGRYVDATNKQRYTTWQLSQPLLMISYGVAREFTNHPSFTIIHLEKPLSIGTRYVRNMFLRIFNYSRHFAPEGKTVVQVEIETEWEYWNDLYNRNRTTYNAEKKRLASECLARLGKYFPGISKDVEITDVATPYTTWRYTLNRNGAWGGWLMSKDLFKETIKRTLPGLRNFYMAGQWVMSGGVAPSLYSGRHSIQLVCRDDEGARFKSLLRY